MSLFLESIKIQNGQPQLLEWHQKRVNNTLKSHRYPASFSLKQAFSLLPPIDEQLYKWRIIYGKQGITSSEVIPYTTRKIARFRLVEANISYDFKYAIRENLDTLKTTSPSEEIIIVKNRLITDTSYSNLIFLRNSTWYTPNSFLLNGVQRQFLLAQHKIISREIRREDLHLFSHFAMINAMLSQDNSPIFSVKDCIID